MGEAQQPGVRDDLQLLTPNGLTGFPPRVGDLQDVRTTDSYRGDLFRGGRRRLIAKCRSALLDNKKPATRAGLWQRFRVDGAGDRPADHD